MTKILVVVAHPDDEAIGCGGTIARHVAEGDQVKLFIFADGETSRDPIEGVTEKIIDVRERENAARRSNEILGVSEVTFLGLPDNRLDTIPLLDLIIPLEKILSQYQPQIVYTHHPSDLNVDHKIVSQATVTACRPFPGQSVKELILFEIVSSTGWDAPIGSTQFLPNRFVDISNFVEKKMHALQEYKHELRDFPHPRSVEGIRDQAKCRGASVGIVAAEAFEIVREIY